VHEVPAKTRWERCREGSGLCCPRGSWQSPLQPKAKLEVLEVENSAATSRSDFACRVLGTISFQGGVGRNGRVLVVVVNVLGGVIKCF